MYMQTLFWKVMLVVGMSKWQNTGLNLPRGDHLILESKITGHGIPTLWIFKD